MRNPVAISMLMIALVLGACSTAQGFGQDVEDTGEYIEDKADDASD